MTMRLAHSPVRAVGDVYQQFTGHAQSGHTFYKRSTYSEWEPRELVD